MDARWHGGHVGDAQHPRRRRGGSAPEQIEMAIAQAVDRGQVDLKELHARATERSERVAALVQRTLQLIRMGERQERLPAWDNKGKPSPDERGGEPMQVKEELDRFQDDMVYFDRHRVELLKKYPEKWVAIHDHEVVGAAKALPTLVAQLERKGLRGKAFVDYVTEREDLLIL